MAPLGARWGHIYSIGTDYILPRTSKPLGPMPTNTTDRPWLSYTLGQELFWIYWITLGWITRILTNLVLYLVFATFPKMTMISDSGDCLEKTKKKFQIPCIGWFLCDFSSKSVKNESFEISRNSAYIKSKTTINIVVYDFIKKLKITFTYQKWLFFRFNNVVSSQLTFLPISWWWSRDNQFSLDNLVSLSRNHFP